MDWIFGREALAKLYLDTLEVGLVDRLALFAPRRKGKSIFLMHDLAPAAESAGYIPVYANLWENLNNPHLPILESLRKAKKESLKGSSIVKFLKTPIQKLSIGIAGVTGELDFATNPQPPLPEHLSEMGALIEELANNKKGKKILLMIDEIQHISTNDAFSPIAYTLRTAADKSKNIKIVFTGSSRSGMKLLFDNSNAAFYNSVERIQFPDMGDDFLEFCQSRLKDKFGKEVDFDDLKCAYIDLDHSPYWITKVIQKVILNDLSVPESCDMVQEELINIEGYDKKIEKLNALDKLIFIEVITPGNRLFSVEMRSFLSTEMKKEIKNTSIQFSVNKLQKMNLITKFDKNIYLVEQPGFGAYLKAKMASPDNNEHSISPTL